MQKPDFPAKPAAERRTSIKRQFFVFSVALFLVILIGGSGAFIFSMRQIVHANASNDLRQMAEIEQIGRAHV